MPAGPDSYSDAQIEELVSHVVGLRMDYIQQLLKGVKVSYSGRRKGELRDRVRAAIVDGKLSVQAVVAYLDKVEPGGKQHVFVLRPKKQLNDAWKDTTAVTRKLRRSIKTKGLLGAPPPVLMPEEFQLSSIKVNDDLVEIAGVEARRYTERDEAYDDETTTAEGLPVQLRAYVERVARSSVRLRWHTNTRHAALHITQATGRGVDRDHYRNLADRFGDAVSSFLDFTEFKDADLHKVIHILGDKERAKTGAWTMSRRGTWDTIDGAELVATSPGTNVSVYDDPKLAAAIGQVATIDTGQAGNLFWLPGGNGSPLTERLHVTIVASDSRVHFMVPSSPRIVEYVIGQIRSIR
jgi:hypothetical protein